MCMSIGLALKSTFVAVYSKVMMGCYYKCLQCKEDPSGREGLSVAGVIHTVTLVSDL